MKIIVAIVTLLSLTKALNLLTNGNFEIPKTQFTQVYNFVIGWNGTMEIGKGFHYNSKWNSQVVRLNNTRNSVITQVIHVQKKGKYLIKYQYAAEEKSNAENSKLKVSWNNVVIDEVVAKNKEIISKEIIVDATNCQNTIKLEGTGSDGITIDNVQLSRIHIHQPVSGNYIMNGNFQTQTITQIHQVSSNVLGWIGTLQIGKGFYYNSRWDPYTQVASFDAKNNNNKISQQIYLEKGGKYLLQYQHAAREGFVQSSKMNVYWNGVLVDQVVAKDQQIHICILMVDAKNGFNYLVFQAIGNSDGMTLDNIELYQRAHIISGCQK